MAIPRKPPEEISGGLPEGILERLLNGISGELFEETPGRFSAGYSASDT